MICPRLRTARKIGTAKALEAELISDPEALARQEARNALRQFDAVMEMVDYFLDEQRPFKLRPSHLLHLHRIALEGISAYAGNFRPAGIGIRGSKHRPVGAHQVPEKVEELCDYVNENWKSKPPIHLAAYCLWRLNWIHPFTDGNGRTSRALSYLVLCLRLGYRLPGTNTIPDQISRTKSPTTPPLNQPMARPQKREPALLNLKVICPTC
ncbi:MAG TPA: Fic family protein [Terriglobales bacterium]|nr:Fic family protein [Terriglobales bacterium]